MCKDSAITSEANREHDTHKKTQVSQQYGQLNVGLLHNAALIVFTGQTCCNSEKLKRVWHEETEDGSSDLIDNKSHTLCPGTKLGDSSSSAFRSMLRRLFKYPPAATSGFTSLLKHFKNAEIILQALGKPRI